LQNIRADASHQATTTLTSCGTSTRPRRRLRGRRPWRWRRRPVGPM
jgi:hypothetical protein